ncbi:MAG: asparagine synthase-related protein [Victivallales bacterium]|jgi:asparagine synthetase B (glutamine-hydrolysing)
MDSADFKPTFSIPSFLLSVTDRRKDSKEKEEVKFSASSENFRLSASYSNVNPAPLIKEVGDKCIILLGSPILDGRINHEKAINLVSDESNLAEKLSTKLNGEFLFIIFNRANGGLKIINDRFTSIPIYYYHNEASGEFHASPYFTCLWKLRKNLGLRINQNTLCEFLFFQRILWTKTYLENVLYLPDASILSVEGRSLSISRYWQRNYEKNNSSLVENARRLAELVERSVKNKTSDGKRYGHFLSGGMDSRSVLAAFEKNYPTCFTATISENRELRTAREIARTKGAKHIFLKLHPEHYSKIFEPSVKVIGGMYNYDHGLFLGYEEPVRQNADVCFHGHGFDYMFQGMYIPGKPIIIRGRTLYYQTLMELPEDLVTYFRTNVSYRIKQADVWSFIRPDKRAYLQSCQIGSISEVLSEGRNLTDSPNDLWEYLTFHHLSRHYSYPNHATIATLAEQRTISFDNDIFDLYLSLPIGQRFSGGIEKKCLEILDPRLAKIWSANTNLPVTASPLRQTAYQLTNFLKHRIFPEKEKPEWTERTWPSREDALRSQPALKNAVLELCKSGTLEEIDFLDMEKIRDEFPRWLEGEDIPGISGDLVQTVLSLGTFLKS